MSLEQFPLAIVQTHCRPDETIYARGIDHIIMNTLAEKDDINQLLTERRGGRNRACILSVLNDRPQNAHRLAERLNLDYKTVNHHLQTLTEAGFLQCSGDSYGAVYLLSDQAQHHWGDIKQVIDSTEFDTG